MKNLSVLFVPAQTDQVASTRYRVSQYARELAARGVRVTVYSALSENATKTMLVSPTLGKLARPAYYARVISENLLRLVPILILAARHRVVYLHRATFPFGLARVLSWVNPRVVFDFDDSIYMADPDDGESGPLKWLKDRTKSSMFDQVLRASRAVIVENDFLRERALPHCARVVKIPGPIDTERFRPAETPPSGRPVIGWIGSPSTTAYLPPLAGPLEKLSREIDFELRFVGSGPYRFGGVAVEAIPWSLENELRELPRFAVGVMPMPDTPWTRGKLGVKMLLYMACGVTPVVSYTPTNAEVIQDGVNGFLVRTEAEWHDRLARLLKDPDLRGRMGREGRRTVEEGFSLKAGVPKLLDLLDSLA